MTRRPVGALLAVLLAVLLVVMLGCGDDGNQDDVDTADPAARLEGQREDVREAARSLLVAAERTLPGVTASSGGSYRGCESAFNEEFRDFRYVAQARIDVDAASGIPAPRVEPLRRVLAEAGFAAGDLEELTNGFVTVAGARDAVRASFTRTGAGAFVGLTVTGPCIGVPEADRDGWLTTVEPRPRIR